ncbi:hypothetical protein GCM10011374_21420 [Kocuria dechangensis]|uniref:Excalibur calcium-binding domain-containing protein n=1 Tax=Kocuria dechangensis TaxID=1176249 RepID=A0A917GVV2_9MICC|nr:excalibur calcium-binding domain-containing protein [Kocuria dechangensis]GGG58302.1 hypothetical protein GCM10011374_21420 [Kocuria dechangensis]
MKKFTAAAAVLAAAGFTGLSMAPASAAPYFANCSEAKAQGVYNIHSSDYRFDPTLDGDGDGYGCDNSDFPLAPVLTAPGSVVTDTTANSFPNCDTAAAYGAYDIPVGDPRYAAHLDGDSDGIACETGGDVQTDVIVDYVPESWNNGTGTGYGQVGQVPVGGADTGVTVEESSSVSGLALGGMALVAAAGATFMVRRRTAQA